MIAAGKKKFWLANEDSDYLAGESAVSSNLVSMSHTIVPLCIDG
jgi:hypothetical protein